MEQICVDFLGNCADMFNILARHDTSSSLPGSSAGCACSTVFWWSAGNIFDNGGINKGKMQPSISCNILVSTSQQQWWLRCLGYPSHALQSQVSNYFIAQRSKLGGCISFFISCTIMRLKHTKRKSHNCILDTCTSTQICLEESGNNNETYMAPSVLNAEALQEKGCIKPDTNFFRAGGYRVYLNYDNNEI